MGTEFIDPSSNATALGTPTRSTVDNKDLTFTVVFSSLEARWPGPLPPPQKATLQCLGLGTPGSPGPTPVPGTLRTCDKHVSYKKGPSSSSSLSPGDTSQSPARNLSSQSKRGALNRELRQGQADAAPGGQSPMVKMILCPEMPMCLWTCGLW